MFCNGGAAPQIYTLSLHDALPIFIVVSSQLSLRFEVFQRLAKARLVRFAHLAQRQTNVRRHRSAPDSSEEHTSELQSLTNLVCRLLLEKKTDSVEAGGTRLSRGVP